MENDEPLRSKPRVNILLVDDHPANLLALRAILDDLGQNLVDAHSGEEAFRLVQRDDYAVVLLDVVMPGLDGFETAKLIRGYSRHIPIIFLTAHDIELTQIERGYMLGAVDFLLKPISPVILRAKVNGFVEIYEARQQASTYLRDLTEKTRQESHRSARLAITQVLTQSDSVEDAATGILQAVCQNLDWDVGLFWTMTPQGDGLANIASWHKPHKSVDEFEADSRKRRFRRGEGLPGRAWQSGKTVWIGDVVGDASFPRGPLAAKAHLHGALGCPIIVGEDTLAVVEFFHSEIRPPDADVLELMNAVAGQIGQFIERKAAEDQLRRSEQRFARFMQHLPGLAWIKDVEGRYVYANDAAERAFRMPRPELYGKTDWEVFNSPTAAHFRENDSRALASESGVFVVETLTDERGVIHHSLVSKFPILGADGQATLVGGMAIDISDRMQAEEQLLRHKQRLELAQHAGRIGTFEWNIRTDEVEWSATEEELFGLAVGSFGGKLENWRDSVHPDDLAGALADCRRAIVERVDLDTEYRIVRGDGQVRWIAAYGKVFYDEDGAPLRMIGVNIDVTERKEADRRKDEFLATLAHELRNPLTPIRNSLQILKVPRLDDASAQKTMGMMERQVEQIVRLVDDLLDVSRAMRGKIELRKQTVALDAVVARAVETVQPLMDAQRHELTIALPPKPLFLDADPVRLVQVIGNLLTNAAKYTEPNGRIHLIAQRDGCDAVLRVQDTGIGIAADVLPRIFDLFVQADYSSVHSQGGLGVGLTLVKSLVEMHRGGIEVRSGGLGKGSEFIVRLPLAAREPATPRALEEGAQPLADVSARRVLVVDDNLDAANSLAALLRIQGHQVRVAYNGVDALEMSIADPPDIIFLDIGMPKMDGYEVARRLRQHNGLDKTVLAALTGWGQKEDRRRSEEAGFHHHLVKPLEPKLLERLLEEVKV